MTEIDFYIQKNQDRFEADLFDWLRIPSIGTNSDYNVHTRAAADWIANQFRKLGLETELIESAGHPLVFAQSEPLTDSPVVLIYGHYDVQPPDPLELWESPPFEPTVRNGNVYARGATDDKGQMITHLFAVESYLKTIGELPVQVKFLIEGEEESGGAGLKAFLRGELDDDISVQEKLSADIAVISDCSQFAPGQPAITHGLRGMVYCELQLQGPKTDLHSGKFGGTITNPANALSQILDSLVDQNGRIRIPDFYGDVLELTDTERSQLNLLDFSDEEFRSSIRVNELSGEHGYSTLERRWCRPTFDIHGIWSGYQEAGAKTVLPANAGAKFSFRLVPNQDPAKIKTCLEAWIRQNCPNGVSFDLSMSDGAPGFVLPLESDYILAASRAIQRGFGTKPVFIRSGGSIPVVNLLKKVPGVDTLLLGWGQDDDNLHSPNEKFSLADFHKGIKTSCYLLDEFSRCIDR